jgi:purine catabolism regulator
VLTSGLHPGQGRAAWEDFVSGAIGASSSGLVIGLGTAAAFETLVDVHMELTSIVARGGSFGDLLQGWRQRTEEPVAVFDRLGRVLARSSAFPASLITRLGERLAGPVAPRLGEHFRLSTATLEALADEGSADAQ